MTVWPASTFCVLPFSTRSWPCSAAFNTLSLATVLMDTATLARSTVRTWPMVTGLPALLWPATVMFTAPAGQLATSAAGTLVSQVPSGSTLAL
ncbi:hypothetical protein D3C78_894370 [compost metagenome]